MAASDNQAEGLKRADPPPWETREGARAETGARILVVDDDERNLLSLQRILEGPGHEIVAVRSGEAALRCLLRGDFAVILMDVLMPGMDGYETATLIRQRERSRHIPIIFLTALNKDDVHMFRGYSAGAVDYVFKPVEPLVLKSKIAVFVELFKKTQEVRRKAEQERRLLAENFRVRAEKLSAEQALRRSEERQALIIQSLPIALYAAEASESIHGPRLLSGNVSGMCGFAATRFQEVPDLWPDRIHPEDRERVLQEVDRLGDTGSFSLEYRWRCADDSYRFFLDQAVLVRDADGRPREVFGTWLDVTERRRMEHQLVHAQKMEAIGQLTGGIAHDFNNMLTVIIGSLDRVQRSFKPAGDGQATHRAQGPGHAMVDRVEMALQAALRCSDLTRRLLAFARRQPLQPRPLDLNDLVSQMADMLRRTLGETIEIDIQCAPRLWIAHADPSQVESAVVNLAINARDAMPEGGRLVIRTANVSLGKDDAARDPELLPGDYVMLAVSDTGAGIPPELLNRVYEPFFTTKKMGQGTGLGLSITYGFVKQSGGHIRIDSEVNRGTTIIIYLPRGERSGRGEAKRGQVEDVVPRARGEVVLAVEDDSEVRRLTVAMLQDLGYEVLEAEDGRAALSILDQRQPVHLLFTDVVMPGGLHGPDLAAEAVRRWPGLKVLFTSAYTDQSAARSTGMGLGRLLKKPYRDHEIAYAVRNALDM